MSVALVTKFGVHKMKHIVIYRKIGDLVGLLRFPWFRLDFRPPRRKTEEPKDPIRNPWGVGGLTRFCLPPPQDLLLASLMGAEGSAGGS